jgi:hypothetical protein
MLHRESHHLNYLRAGASGEMSSRPGNSRWPALPADGTYTRPEISGQLAVTGLMIPNPDGRDLTQHVVGLIRGSEVYRHLVASLNQLGYGWTDFRTKSDKEKLQQAAKKTYVDLDPQFGWSRIEKRLGSSQWVLTALGRLVTLCLQHERRSAPKRESTRARSVVPAATPLPPPPPAATLFPDEQATQRMRMLKIEITDPATSKTMVDILGEFIPRDASDPWRLDWKKLVEEMSASKKLTYREEDHVLVCDFLGSEIVVEDAGDIRVVASEVFRRQLFLKPLQFTLRTHQENVPLKETLPTPATIGPASSTALAESPSAGVRETTAANRVLSPPKIAEPIPIAPLSVRTLSHQPKSPIFRTPLPPLLYTDPVSSSTIPASRDDSAPASCVPQKRQRQSKSSSGSNSEFRPSNIASESSSSRSSSVPPPPSKRQRTSSVRGSPGSLHPAALRLSDGKISSIGHGPRAPDAAEEELVPSIESGAVEPQPVRGEVIGLPTTPGKEVPVTVQSDAVARQPDDESAEDVDATASVRQALLTEDQKQTM